MMARLSKSLALCAVVIAIAACGGCVLPAATILPAATGAAPVVVEPRGSGRGDSFWVARYDDVVKAALRAGQTLSLELREKTVEEDNATLVFADDRDTEITLRIDRRTATVTRIRYDVGSRDLESFARLVGQQIIDELNDADAFLVDWSDKKEADTK